MKTLTILLSLTFILLKINQDFQSQFQSEPKTATDENVKILIKLYDNKEFEIFKTIKNKINERLDVLINETEWKKLRLKDFGYELLNETCKKYISEHY